MLSDIGINVSVEISDDLLKDIRIKDESIEEYFNVKNAKLTKVKIKYTLVSTESTVNFERENKQIEKKFTKEEIDQIYNEMCSIIKEQIDIEESKNNLIKGFILSAQCSYEEYNISERLVNNFKYKGCSAKKEGDSIVIVYTGEE